MPSLLNPPPPHDPERTLKRLRAFHIVLAVFVLGLGLIFVVGFVQGFTRNGARQEGLVTVEARMKGPVISSLLASGCPHALVLRRDQLASTLSSMAAAMPKDFDASAAVFCFSMDASSPLPDCAAVAAAYVSAPGRHPGKFFVAVEQRRPRRAIGCWRMYGDLGEDLGPAGPRAPPL